MSNTSVAREPGGSVAHGIELLTAALVVLVLLYGLQAWWSVRDEALLSLRNRADALVISVESTIRRSEGLLASIAAEFPRSGSSLPPEQVRSVLERYRVAMPEVVSVEVLSPDGGGVPLLASPDVPGIAPWNRDLLRAGGMNRAGSDVRPQIGRPVALPESRSWVVPVRLRTPGMSGQTVAVVARAGWPEPERWLANAWGVQGGMSGLLTDGGDLVVSSSDVGEGRSEFSDVVSSFQRTLRLRGTPSGGDTVVNGSLGSTGGYFAFRRLGRHPLTVFTAVPDTAIWSGWMQRVKLPLILCALATGGLIFCSAWVRRQQRARSIERESALAVFEAQEVELHRQSTFLAETQRAAQVGAWELDLSTGALLWTEEAYRIHGVTPSDFTPALASVCNLYMGSSGLIFQAALEKSLESPQTWEVEVELEMELPGKSAQRAWVRISGRTDFLPSGEPIRTAGFLQNVTDRHVAEDRIARLAHYDELTSLANRSLFTHHLTRALALADSLGRKLAVLFLDLDRFKIVNDTLGHDAGDLVLKEIARRISENVAVSGLVARLGGDEFVVVMDEFEDFVAVTEVAGRLLSEVDHPVVFEGQELSLTASIGIATFPRDGLDLKSLLKHADIAMYRAKEQGKNRFAFYSAVMNTANVDRLSLESSLRKAVADRDQFVLHFQPKVSVVDGRITGAEALVRWLSPERGLIPPNAFIALAEETGLIAAIGEWVLETACRHVMDWARKGLPPVRVAVNLSARQFHSTGFLESVRRILRESGVPPDSIELELTESAMMQNVEYAAGLLSELKALGVHITVDDFGTGYSSLSYLKRLPLDALKVDRSFVRDVPIDQDDAAITRAVIALAHSLRLNVVAEGVETEEQFEFLRQLNCDEVQGFLLSHPLPVWEFENLLRGDHRLLRVPVRNAA